MNITIISSMLDADALELIVEFVEGAQAIKKNVRFHDASKEKIEDWIRSQAEMFAGTMKTAELVQGVSFAKEYIFENGVLSTK